MENFQPSSSEAAPAAAPRGRPHGQRLRAAVIGAGGISLQHLAYLAESPFVEIAAICDLSPVTAEIASRKFGGAPVYTDVATMLAEQEPSVVHVLTPAHTHAALITQAIEANCHVICEKPLAVDGATARALLDLAASHRVHLTESHNYRFNDGTQRLLALGADDALGPVREVEIRIALPFRDPAGRFANELRPDPIHRLPAGVIHDVLPHMTYLLDHLSRQAQWTEVRALWHNYGGGEVFSVDDLDAIVAGKHAQGPVHGRIRFCASTFPDAFQLTIRGEKGEASTDLFHPYLEQRRSRPVGAQLTPIADHLSNGVGLMRSGLRNFTQKLLQFTPYHGLHRYLDETYQALVSGAPVPVSPRDVLAAVDLIDVLVAERGAELGEPRAEVASAAVSGSETHHG